MSETFLKTRDQKCVENILIQILIASFYCPPLAMILYFEEFWPAFVSLESQS